MLPHVRGWQKIPTMFNIFANCLKANLICECFVYCLKLVLIFLQWTSVLQARAISTATTAIRAWAATHVGTASPHVSLRVLFCFIRWRHTPFNYSLKPYHHYWHTWNRIAHNKHLSLHRHLKGDITPSIENNLSDKRTYDKQLSQADKVKNLNPNERFKLWCYFFMDCKWSVNGLSCYSAFTFSIKLLPEYPRKAFLGGTMVWYDFCLTSPKCNEL